MSVNQINIVSFRHKNSKLPVAFWQRVTYTHPTGLIPTPRLLESEACGKFRVIRGT